jgi:hypothetical protein
MSATDAENRAKNWDKVFSNLDEIVEDRTYAGGSPGYSSAGLHGIEFFDATVAAMIKSYSGIFSVERAMDQPNASSPYMNLYGVKTGTLISPNIGVSNTFVEADGYVSKNISVTDPTAANTVVNTSGGDVIVDAIPVVPGSLKITATEGSNNEYIVTDNGAGALVAAPGVLATGTVDYGLGNNNPEITIKVGTVVGSNVAVYNVEFVQDTPKTINEKIKPELEYYNASTSPVIVPYEINQVANLSAKKALGIDMRGLTLSQITDEYTKLINKKTADRIEASASNKSEVTIDISAFSIQTSDFRTYLEAFMAQLMMVDTVMAEKTEKAVNVSAYLVSLKLGDIFMQLDMITSK